MEVDIDDGSTTDQEEQPTEKEHLQIIKEHLESLTLAQIYEVRRLLYDLMKSKEKLQRK